MEFSRHFKVIVYKVQVHWTTSLQCFDRSCSPVTAKHHHCYHYTTASSTGAVIEPVQSRPDFQARPPHPRGGVVSHARDRGGGPRPPLPQAAFTIVIIFFITAILSSHPRLPRQAGRRPAQTGPVPITGPKARVGSGPYTRSG